MVIIITLVAERANPRLAGVLIGFPLGAGLTLFFLGVEQGAAFASESSLWSIQGILATVGFCWCYRCSIKLLPHNLYGSLCLGCLCGLVGMLLSYAAALVYLAAYEFKLRAIFDRALLLLLVRKANNA